MPTLTVDGKEVTVEPGTTVLQACEEAGAEIPRFCYHERLSIAGNCRMCLVEMEKSPKPIASCAMPAGDGMVIHTNTETVKKAREGVMEFLLINHPLDCPICDQGGECDLQDQAMAYGRGLSRFHENKRAVEEKYMGPLIKTIMTRCIHCTRCVRFAAEVAGVEEIGAVGRGEDMEITTYLEQAVTSELSGNVIDLCPVGALTSKPYAFTARSWELRKTESADVHDAVGSNIRVDTRGREVMRILPRLNEDVNEEWLADKSRFAYDGLRRQRLDRPYVRRDGKLVPASWDEAFTAIADKVTGVDGARMAAIAGDLACAESIKAVKDLMAALGSANIDCRQDGAALDPSCRASYLFNTTIAGIEEADACLLIGTNPRHEAALINARLRKRWLAGGFKVASVGPNVDLTYKVDNLGAGPETLSQLVSGQHPFLQVLKDAERPMLIVGQGALARPDGAAVLAAARKIAEDTGMIGDDWNGFNVLHTAAARVAGLDLGFVPGTGGRDTGAILDGASSGDIDVVWLLGADEIDMSRLGNAFVIYMGTHGDAGAHRADVILPAAAYTEKNATWVNTEGRVQMGYRAGFPPGDAREDWTIVRALSATLGHTLPYDSLPQLRVAMAEDAPHLAEEDAIAPAAWGPFGLSGDMNPAPFMSPVTDYYLTNPICRASATMAQCSAEVGGHNEKATGTDG
jgi:NADH-quinone oxidoreductase subunit G